MYDSKFEARYAKDLEYREKTKDIKSWEKHIPVPLIVNNYHIADYEIDFIVHHNDGTVEYVECKGYQTPLWVLKWKIFEAIYGNKKGVLLSIVKDPASKAFMMRKMRTV